MQLKENKVVTLISTLSKSEKRNFTLFATRNQKKDLLFLEMFKLYEKYGPLSDEILIQKIPKLKLTQVKNVRSHLYNQLLISLRLMQQKNNEDIAIRQQIDFSKVLYNKGLYKQALELLTKIKRQSIDKNRSVLALEILFFEKAIESQNITKSIKTKATDLVNQSNQVLTRLQSIMEYSNLNLELYAYYLKYGFCFSQLDLKRIENEFSTRLTSVSNSKNFYSSLYLFQSRCWYYYIRQDFSLFLKNAKAWVNLFEQTTEMKSQRPNLYMKGLHHVISGAFFLQDYHSFIWAKKLLESFSIKSFSYNEKGTQLLYVKLHELDDHFFKGNFSSYSGEYELIHLLEQNPYHWDNHRLAIFYYKLGCIAFGQEDYGDAISHFLNVGQYYRANSESKVYLFSKLLLALSHAEIGNYHLVDSQVKALQRVMSSSKSTLALEKTLVQMISKLNRVEVDKQRTILLESLHQFQVLKQRPFMEINFLHFYVIEWIEAKLDGKKAQYIIAKSFQKKHSTFV